MTWAPWAAASRAASSCLSSMDALSPVQSVCSSAALTLAIIGPLLVPFPRARS